MTNYTTSTCALVSEEAAFADAAAFRSIGLKTIETALVKARTDAEHLEEAVVAYFIDMAIAEVKRQRGLQEEGSLRRRDYKTKKTVQLID